MHTNKLDYKGDVLFKVTSQVDTRKWGYATVSLLKDGLSSILDLPSKVGIYSKSEEAIYRYMDLIFEYYATPLLRMMR